MIKMHYINASAGPYTLRLRPAAANQDPGTLLTDLLNVLTDHILIIALILVALFRIARRH